MPVSGLVLTLSDQQDLRARAIAAIRQEPRLEIGVIESARMAIVMETTTTEEDKQLWSWLNQLPGVVFVDVALVGLEDDPTSPPPATCGLASSPVRTASTK